jgi:hypothetical protein
MRGGRKAIVVLLICIYRCSDFLRLVVYSKIIDSTGAWQAVKFQECVDDGILLANKYGIREPIILTDWRRKRERENITPPSFSTFF